MKKRGAVYLGIAFLLMSFRVSAQLNPEREREERLRREAAEAEIQREELLNLQKETVRALQLHNSSFFNRMYSDDFMGTSPSGANLDKTKLVAAVQDMSIQYSSFVATDIQVRALSKYSSDHVPLECPGDGQRGAIHPAIESYDRLRPRATRMAGGRSSGDATAGLRASVLY